jgi:hypothetical protein
MKKHLLSSVFAIIILFVYLAVGIGLYLIFDNIVNLGNIWVVGLLATISVLLLLYLGLEFYSLRLHVPIIYGGLEIVIAVWTVVLFSTKKSILDPTQILIFYSSLYIIVRGFDNIHRYYKENKELKHWIKSVVKAKLLLARTFGKLGYIIDNMDKNTKTIDTSKDDNNLNV